MKCGSASRLLLRCGLVLAGACDTGVRLDPNPGAQQRTDLPAYMAPDAAVFDNVAPDAAVFTVPPDAAVVPDVCADVEAKPMRLRPSVTLVVDGSGSMACRYPEPADCDCEGQLRGTCSADAGPSRWQALRDALFDPDGVVTRLATAVDFGLIVYHDPVNAPMCPTLPVDLSAAAREADMLANAFPDTPPGANTPTALALTHALASVPDGSDDHPQHLVLATDGKPHVCFDSVTLEAPAIDYDAVVDVAREGQRRGVVLHVLSVAPALGEFGAHLNDVAKAGGTSTARIPGDRAALSADLQAVIAAAIPCTLTLDGEVDESLRCAGTVTLSNAPLTCEAQDRGYRMLDGSHLELLGQACTQFKNDPSAALSVTFPCKAFQAR